MFLPSSHLDRAPTNFGTEPALHGERAAAVAVRNEDSGAIGQNDAVFTQWSGMRSGRRYARAATYGQWRPQAANRCRSIPCPQVQRWPKSRNGSIKETHMSSIANLGSAPAALPQLNLHPHGHKKGLSGSDTAPQLPVRAKQNLFSNLLQSLEQAIGLQLTAPPAAAPASPAVTKISIHA